MKLILLMMLLRGRKPPIIQKACVVSSTTTTQQKWDAVLEQIYRKVEQLEVYKQYAEDNSYKADGSRSLIARLADAMIVTWWEKTAPIQKAFFFHLQGTTAD